MAFCFNDMGTAIVPLGSSESISGINAIDLQA